MSTDTVLVLGLAVGASLGVLAAGATVLHAVRRRSLSMQIAVVALTALGAVMAGAVATAQAMFLSSHDLGVLMVVLAVAGTVGVAGALLLGRRVAASGRALSEVTRQIAAGRPPAQTARMATAELDRLAGDLATMERQLIEAQRRERALESARRELVAWVSHDLRTPLAGIRAMAEALEDGVVADAAGTTRYHRMMREEADRLAGLVDDLFELSRIHAGALQLHLERISLADLVSDALSGADPVAAAKGVRLHGHVHEPAPALSASPSEVLRVLRNLLHNAIRHTPADGTITVEAGVGAGVGARAGVYVSVADSCGGIPESDLDRVFEVAFRGEAARTPGSDGGGGLGLAIARGIVEAHAGRISVSNEGAGCRFLIELPA
ncbi:MAG TPA: HAMP domain-containing sensor histidine kinase [Mycobacteriales bacterium]|nr:HAMP domain-containing sensor histidine kinase [Mycobacteriales bacterium]